MAVSIKTVDVEKEKEAAREEGYKQGLEEAWEIARKIMLSEQLGGYSMSNLNRIFGTRNFSVTNDILEKFSIHEAKEKIETYEAEQAKPKLGDVVKCSAGSTNFIGIYYAKCCLNHWILVPGDEAPQRIGEYWTIEKTGKHFDIQSMLDEIG